MNLRRHAVSLFVVIPVLSMSVASMSPDTSHSGVEFRSPHSPYYGSVYIDSEATISEMTTRRLFGFPATPAFVNELKNSSHDVGSSTVSLPLTVEETEELERRSAIHTLFSDHLEAIVRSRADFGGVYIDQLAGGKVVVLTTGDPAVVASELSAIEPRMRKNLIIRPVSFSWSQLSEALGRLFDNRTAWFRDVPVYEASIEVEQCDLSVSAAAEVSGCSTHNRRCICCAWGNRCSPCSGTCASSNRLLQQNNLL